MGDARDDSEWDDVAFATEDDDAGEVNSRQRSVIADDDLNARMESFTHMWLRDFEGKYGERRFSPDKCREPVNPIPDSDCVCVVAGVKNGKRRISCATLRPGGEDATTWAHAVTCMIPMIALLF